MSTSLLGRSILFPTTVRGEGRRDKRGEGKGEGEKEEGREGRGRQRGREGGRWGRKEGGRTLTHVGNDSFYGMPIMI